MHDGIGRCLALTIQLTHSLAVGQLRLLHKRNGFNTVLSEDIRIQ